MPELELAGAVSSRAEALRSFSEQFHGRGFRTIDELCDDPDIEAVWVATPSEYHCEHAVRLANHGKHIVMEKPFAVTLEECERMIDAADRNKVALIAGGSHSFNPSYLSMRKVITSGRLGRLGALTDWAFTEWMVRPREQHEVDPGRDGGELLNQGPHPIDAIRLLGGGLIRSVRGTMLDFGLRGRACAGYFTAYMEFEDGTPATLVYNGYGYIGGWELVSWGETEQRQAGLAANYAYRRRLREGIEDELPARELNRFGTAGGRNRAGSVENAWVPNSPGNVIASCERGEIRQSPTGLFVYDDEGRHEEPFTVGGNVRLNEAAELRRALAGKPYYRDGRWGMATLEVVLAIAESAATRKEIHLNRQVKVLDGIDQ
jgi:phthalate 4,5-cis-dihydrodiol dehydrogenase